MAERVAILHAHHASEIDNGGWGNLPPEVIVPAAGCYAFYAQWKTGNWIPPFTAGR